MPAIQGIPGERANREAHTGAEDSSILVYRCTRRGGTAERRARIFQRARHAARVS